MMNVWWHIHYLSAWIEIINSSNCFRAELLKAMPQSIAGKWKPGEEQRLAAAVHAVSRTKHGESVTEGIQWPAVAKIVRRLGYSNQTFHIHIW